MVQGGAAEGEPGDSRARAFGRLLWVLIPLLSVSSLAWLPSVQAWWRSRGAGWLITSLILGPASVGSIVGQTQAPDNSAFDLLTVATMVGGIAAAARAKPVVFGPDPAEPRAIAEDADPAVRAVLDRRQRRHQSREIVSRDPAMAYELGIGRPDVERTYDDGGLVDLNNVSADGLVLALRWDRPVAEAYVSGRDLRGGYASWDEVSALSGLELVLVERDAERLVLLPWQPR